MGKQAFFTAILCCVTLAVSAPAGAGHPLTPHTAVYKVKVSILSGKLQTEVKATDDGYAVSTVLSSSGLARMFVRGDLRENSTFAVVDGSVQPHRYQSADLISKKDKFMDFTFDWQHNQVTGSINDEEIDLNFDGQLFDRVSIQYELMLDLLSGQQSDQYELLDDNEPKLLHVSNIGSKSIKVPYGKFEAIGIQHRKLKSDRVTTLWCVEELDYLPVMIEQHRDGKRVMRAVLASYTTTPTPAATSAESTAASPATNPR